MWHGHVCTTFVKQISLDKQATITLLCMSHSQGRPSFLWLKMATWTSICWTDYSWQEAHPSKSTWNPPLSWKSPLSSQNLDTSLPSEMPPCHHSWCPPIVSGSENQFRQKKKKEKPISQNRAWIIDDNMLLWCCSSSTALKFCLDNNKQTTLVVIPSTSTKEKRQKGSRLTCANGTRFSLHPWWWGKRSTERRRRKRRRESGKCFEDFLLITLVLTNNRIPLQSSLAKAFLATWC